MLPMLPLGTIDGPEIVIGILGRIGLDTRLVSEKIRSVLSEYKYNVEIIKVTGLLPTLRALPEIVNHPKAYPADSGSSICSRGVDPAWLAVLRGLSRLMMSQ